MSTYIAHAHGVAAYVKLVRVQLELKLAAVPLAEVPQFLERAGPDGVNPLDGRPFRWDREHRSLSFDPLRPALAPMGDECHDCRAMIRC